MKKDGHSYGAIIGIIALIVALVAVSFSMQSPTTDQGTWRCSHVVCDKTMTPQNWVATFCKLNATKDMVCSFTLKGQPVQMPLANINTTIAASMTCVEYNCTEEVRVRPVNYVMNTTMR